MNNKDLDYELLYGVASTISSFVGFLLGLLAVILVYYLTIVTAVDLIYMSFPSFAELINRKFDHKETGGLHIISEDARKAVEESQISDKPAALIYLKNRALTYIVAAILLVIIVTGGQDLRTIVANIVIRILNAIGFIA